MEVSNGIHQGGSCTVNEARKELCASSVASLITYVDLRIVMLKKFMDFVDRILTEKKMSEQKRLIFISARDVLKDIGLNDQLTVKELRDIHDKIKNLPDDGRGTMKIINRIDELSEEIDKHNNRMSDEVKKLDLDNDQTNALGGSIYR